MNAIYICVLGSFVFTRQNDRISAVSKNNKNASYVEFRFNWRWSLTPILCTYFELFSFDWKRWWNLKWKYSSNRPKEIPIEITSYFFLFVCFCHSMKRLAAYVFLVVHIKSFLWFCKAGVGTIRNKFIVMNKWISINRNWILYLVRGRGYCKSALRVFLRMWHQLECVWVITTRANDCQNNNAVECAHNENSVRVTKESWTVTVVRNE